MTDLVNYPTPTNANVKFFLGAPNNGAALANRTSTYTWQKPKGASFVWFTLIGPGGRGSPGDGANPGGGGGSGGVTNVLAPAFLIPDNLFITISSSTFIAYRGRLTASTLFSATGGGNGSYNAGGAGGSAATVGSIIPACLYQSIAGQAGSVNSTISASTTTFLSGGAGGSSASTITGNYGYSVQGTIATPANGYFQMQPIIFGLGGGNSLNGSFTGNGGIGCGGGGNVAASTQIFGNGGPGMAVIISW